VADLAQQFAGDFALFLGEPEALKEMQAAVQRPIAEVAERVAFEANRGGVGAQARTMTGGAGHLADKMLEPLAVGGADARGLVEGGEEAFVLEADGAETFGRGSGGMGEVRRP